MLANKFEFAEVLIEGNLEKGIIIVKLLSYLDAFKFHRLVTFLRNKRYKFVQIWNNKFWYKENIENFDEELNDIENFLLDNEISFMNKIPQYETIPHYR